MTIVLLLVIAIVIFRLVDYTKCPHCHLADVKALSKEYWEIESAKQKRTISVFLWMNLKISRSLSIYVLSHKKNLTQRKNSYLDYRD